MKTALFLSLFITLSMFTSSAMNNDYFTRAGKLTVVAGLTSVSAVCLWNGINTLFNNKSKHLNTAKC